MKLLLNPKYFRWLDRLPAPRMPRIRKRGEHHVWRMRIDLATATVPVKQTTDSPPWDRVTAANPVYVPEPRGDWGTVPELEAAKVPEVMA